MSTDVFEQLGLDPHDPADRAAITDARAHADLITALVDARTSQGLTQAEVARRMGTTQSRVSSFEQLGGDPRLSTIQRYARATGVDVRMEVNPAGNLGDDMRTRREMSA